mgnify:CR=1 FL=1
MIVKPGKYISMPILAIAQSLISRQSFMSKPGKALALKMAASELSRPAETCSTYAKRQRDQKRIRKGGKS